MRRAVLGAAMLLFAVVSATVSTEDSKVEAAPYPPHNTVINSYIRNNNKNACYVSYMHGNYAGSAYSTIKRKSEIGPPNIWPSTSTTFPPSPKRFGWGLIYDDVNPYGPPWGARCGHVSTLVAFVPPGGSCCSSSSNFSAGFGWTQATGTGNIVGSTGYVHHEDWIYQGLRAQRSYPGL